jgi:hypothetical protein
VRRSANNAARLEPASSRAGVGGPRKPGPGNGKATAFDANGFEIVGVEDGGYRNGGPLLHGNVRID